MMLNKKIIHSPYALHIKKCIIELIIEGVFMTRVSGVPGKTYPSQKLILRTVRHAKLYPPLVCHNFKLIAYKF